MDIKKLLEKEFSKENEFNNLLKGNMPDDKSISSEKFNDKFSKYINDYKAKENDYINNVKKSVSLYESRLNAEDLFAKKDKIYQNALAKKQSNDFYNAYVKFGSIKGHKDSDALCKECLDILEAKYNDAIAKAQIGEFDSAISILEQIKPFKDSKKLIIKFSSDKNIYSKKDSIYNSALSSFNAGKYYDALMSFRSILGHKDSNDYINKCNVLLEEKYNEAQKLFNSRNYNNALVAFKNIVSYKDTIEMVKKCEKAIEDEKERNKKNAQLAKQAAAKKKKQRMIISVSSIVCAVIAVIIILVTTVFIPNARLKENTQKYENGISLINRGNYKEAGEIFAGLNFKDSDNLYKVSMAGESFKNGDYDGGIKNMCSANGSTDVAYDSNGGVSQKSQETITTYHPINNSCTKEYYSFDKWEIVNFSIVVETNLYLSTLSLKANFSLINYKINYSLNGGVNNSSNPSSYTYESPNINLLDPSKTGYKFTGWTCNGQSISSIPHHSSGDKTLTANWTAKTYTVNLDANGGTYAGQSTYTVTFDVACSFPTPQKDGCSFLGWYYNNTKVGSTWNIDANCTIKAKWQSTILSYLSYTTTDRQESYEGSYFDTYSYNIKGIKITGLKSGFTGKSIIIPEDIDGTPVVEIADNAFKNSSCASNITNVEIPNTVVRIGAGALANFVNLTKLTIPFAGENQNMKCGIKSVFGHIFGQDYPNTTQTYWRPAAYGHDVREVDYYIPSSLTEVKVTGTIYSPGEFSNCSNIKVIIPNNETTYIGFRAFSGCNNLESFNMSNFTKLETIGDYAFTSLTKLNDVCLPSTVKSLGETAFRGTGIKKISFSSSITSLPDGVFMECTQITSFTIPITMTYFGFRSLYGCTGLTEVTYLGSKLQWSRTSSDSTCIDKSNITVVHCVDGDVSWWD